MLGGTLCTIKMFGGMLCTHHNAWRYAVYHPGVPLRRFAKEQCWLSVSPRPGGPVPLGALAREGVLYP